MGATVPRKANTLKDFWDRVDQSGGPDACWLWQGPVDGFGYGQVMLDYVLWKTHRLSYTLHHGEIGEGLVVRHKCDTPACCNPLHLVEGTQADNMADRNSRGRQARGDGNAASVLTEDVVRYCRGVHVPRHPEFSAAALARKFGVEKSTMSKIVKGKLWKHSFKEAA